MRSYSWVEFNHHTEPSSHYCIRQRSSHGTFVTPYFNDANQTPECGEVCYWGVGVVRIDVGRGMGGVRGRCGKVCWGVGEVMGDVWEEV